MFHTHHGPSFQRLYADTSSRRLVEACDWYSRLDDAYPDPPAWADVVLDYRIARQPHSDMDGDACRVSGGACDDGRNTPLPDTLDAPTLVWASEMPGWVLEGFTVRGVHRHTQVLRFTDPDGFRGAFVLSGKAGTLADHVRGRFEEWPFETGRFTHLFPTADADLLSAIQPPPGSMRSPHTRPRFAPLRDNPTPVAAPQPAPDTASGDGTAGLVARHYRLPVLRDALRDPAGWFGLCDASTPTAAAWQTLTCEPSTTRGPVEGSAEDDTESPAEDATEGTASRFPDAMGPDCPVSPDRVLLAYAMAGHTSYAPVARLVAAGLDAAELARWREGVTRKGRPGRFLLDDELILDWFSVVGGGGKARGQATAFAAAGVSPTRAQRWKVLGDTPSAYADRIKEFEAAGWEPDDVLRVAAALDGLRPGVPYRRVSFNNSSYKRVAEWTFTTPQAAIDFHACGYACAQARAVCEEADDPGTVHASVAAMATLRRPVVSAAPAW